MSQPAIQEAIHLLFSGQDLTEAQADAAMSEIMLGEATPAQIGAFLAALRIKGETVEEITGCAAAMRRSAVRQHQRRRWRRRKKASSTITAFAGRRGMRGQTRQSSHLRRRRCARALGGAAAHARPGRRVHRGIGIAFLFACLTRPCVSIPPRTYRRPHHLQHPRPLTNPPTTHQRSASMPKS